MPIFLLMYFVCIKIKTFICKSNQVTEVHVSIMLTLDLKSFGPIFLGPLYGIRKQAYIIQSLGFLITTLWGPNEPFIIEKDLFMTPRLKQAFCRSVKKD